MGGEIGGNQNMAYEPLINKRICGYLLRLLFFTSRKGDVYRENHNQYQLDTIVMHSFNLYTVLKVCKKSLSSDH